MTMTLWFPGWTIMVVEGEPHLWPRRSANAEAREVAQVVPVKVAARWRAVRVSMTTDLRKRVREDRN